MKRILLPLSCVIMMTLTVNGQRITSFSLAGKTACGPSAAFNPTNQNAASPGDLQIVFPIGTDLTNVTPVFTCGEGFEVTAPSPMATNFTSTVEGVRVSSVATPATSWADYKITCKVIKPTILPFALFGADATSSDSWSTLTEGWAAARIDKNKTVAGFGGSSANLIVAFNDDNPSEVTSLSYQINAAGTDFGTNVFDVHESPNGTDWTTVVSYTNVNMPKSTASVAEKTKNHTLLSTTRYVRWTYTTRATSVNATVQAISIQKGVPSGVASLTMDAVKVIAEGNRLSIFAAEPVERIEIVSLNGQTVKTQIQPQNQMDISDLPEGYYFAHCIMSGEQTCIARFIK